jgi:hypothetical protein
MWIFTEGGKLEDLEKNPCGKGENKQLNSNEVPVPRIEPTTHCDHSGERRAYSCKATHATKLKARN